MARHGRGQHDMAALARVLWFSTTFWQFGSRFCKVSLARGQQHISQAARPSTHQLGGLEDIPSITRWARQEPWAR